MIIIGFTDIHGNAAIFSRMKKILAEADVVLLTGDITHFGGKNEADSVLKPVMRHSQKVFAVSGNCDYPEVDRYLDSKAINLHGKGVVYNDVAFLGSGGSLTTPFQTPNELTEDEIKFNLEKGYAEVPSDIPLVLFSHQPPFQTRCDRLSFGEHVGSKALRQFIEQHHPKVCFTGHIHESVGVDKIGDTYIINPGMAQKGSYAYSTIENKPLICKVGE